MIVIGVVIVVVSVLLLELIQRESKCFGNLKEISKDLLKDFLVFQCTSERYQNQFDYIY